MTAGQEALLEAMRFEQAKIYGRTCPEHRHPRARVSHPHREDMPVDSDAPARSLRLIHAKEAS